MTLRRSGHVQRTPYGETLALVIQEVQRMKYEARSFQSTDRRQLDMLRAIGATPWQLFWMAKVPNSLPYIFVGLNILW
jgi:ABC-type proline/glycine betaine transport system permease subunit